MFQVLSWVSERKKKLLCTDVFLALRELPFCGGEDNTAFKNTAHFYTHPFSTYTHELTPSPSKQLLGN